jgi:O-phospho-L-seryl-tRNASec:L-selenocysteinyl-tRNA synthase
MDSNNFPNNCGVGEREGRVYSNLVSRKTWSLAHGVGRSGDLREPQPKAAGSSMIVALTNSLVVDWLRFNGARSIKEAFVAPVATGMAIGLCLLTLRLRRPNAKYVVWSRIDQKACFKAIITAGYIPIIVDLVKGKTAYNYGDNCSWGGGGIFQCKNTTIKSVFNNKHFI